MLGIVDCQPMEGCHHLTEATGSASRPVNSLSIAKPFLAAHPRLKLHTYGDIDERGSQKRAKWNVSPRRWLTS